MFESITFCCFVVHTSYAHPVLVSLVRFSCNCIQYQNERIARFIVLSPFERTRKSLGVCIGVYVDADTLPFALFAISMHLR